MAGDDPTAPSGDRPRFTLRTIPSTDRAFAAHVRALVGRLDRPSPPALEERLRALYPLVVVRPRELAGERDSIWYVYRDGRWMPPDPPEEWSPDDRGRLLIGRDGRILEADSNAARLLALDPEALAGRHYAEFAVPGGDDVADALFEVILDVGEAEGTLRARAADGRIRHFRQRARLTADGVEVFVRPLDEG